MEFREYLTAVHQLNIMRFSSIALLIVITLQIQAGYARQDDYLISRVEERQFMRQNITAITHDATGFVWFGTENGLFRFDGQSVLPFQHDPSNSKSVPGTHIHAAYKDSKETLWFSVRNRGLSRYHPENRSFETFLPDEIPFEPFDFSTISGSGTRGLWLAASGGEELYRFDVETEEFSRLKINYRNNRRDNMILTVLELPDGSVMAGTNFSGLIHLSDEGVELNYREIPIPHYDPGLDQSYSVTALLYQGEGILWVGSYSGGLYRYDMRSGSLEKPEALIRHRELENTNVYDFHLDDDGILWAGTEDGLLLFDTAEMAIHYHYTYEPLNQTGLVNNRIRVVYEDNSGLIWVGNEYGGVHSFQRKLQFTHVGNTPEQPGRLTGSVVRTFFMPDEEQLWVAVDQAGITILDANTLERTGSIRQETGVPYRISNDGITRFLRDPDGGIWIGTWGGGLNYYDPDTGRFTHFVHDARDENSIPDNRVQVLYIDSADRFWVGTENGLSIFDRGEQRFTRILNDPDNPPALSQNSLQSLAFVEDEEGIFWIGTWGGLNRYDPETHTIRHYLMDFNDPGTLRSNRVISLYDDGEGTLWIGTFSGGLSRLDKATDTITTYTQIDGLANNVVFGILPDTEGNLWLSTNNGLSRFNPETEYFITFNREDGIPGDEYWWGSAYASPDGRLMFGSIFGFTIFNPLEIREVNFQAPIVISNVRVHNRDAFPDTNGQIVLTHRDDQITFEFASLDFANANRIEYAYMLEGVDRDWVFSGNRNFTNYSNLAGGEYTFRVMATNSIGVWNEQIAELPVVIRLPYWQTFWFQVVVSLFFLFLFVGYVRYRNYKIREQNLELEQQVLERTSALNESRKELITRNERLEVQTRLLTVQKNEIEKQKETILEKSRELEESNSELIELNNEKNSLIGVVSHDLRSPLSSVLGVIDLIRLRPDMPAEQQKELFDTLEEMIQDQLKMVSKILDIESVESGKINLQMEEVNLNRLTSEIVDQYRSVAGRKEIELRFDENAEEILITADRGYLKNQVMDNLLSNAIKYSGKKTIVNILIENHKDHVKWGVKDQGPGITESDKKKLFLKYQRLSAKPTAGESSVGLGLSIVKRVAEAMNVNVWVESEPGEGATFWLEFKKEPA
ncbi:MAG: hypothetical protein EA360_05895 [Balneolaceae bacterium]|nr:MAG: hypothetical protein EA360_05895 [Balneolaceae bacterium]